MNATQKTGVGGGAYELFDYALSALAVLAVPLFAIAIGDMWGFAKQSWSNGSLFLPASLFAIWLSLAFDASGSRYSALGLMILGALLLLGFPISNMNAYAITDPNISDADLTYRNGVATGIIWTSIFTYSFLLAIKWFIQNKRPASIRMGTGD